MPNKPITETIRIQLNYPASIVDQPIVYRLVTEFALVPNIRRANIDLRSGGFLYLELTGERESLHRAIAWLETVGVGIDSIGVDGAQEWAI